MLAAQQVVRTDKTVHTHCSSEERQCFQNLPKTTITTSLASFRIIYSLFVSSEAQMCVTAEKYKRMEL